MKKLSGPPTANSRTKKVIPQCGTLAFLNSGEKIDQGALCCLIIIISIYLLMRGFSGAASVSMVGPLFSAQHVKSV